MALTTLGKVVCWGNNFCSQCDVPVNLSEVTAVSGGSEFTAALTLDGTVVCWGGQQRWAM
jgi:alpha-tubulin suppressor-like RCC1 family protein